MQATKRDAKRVLQKLQVVEVSCKHHHAGFLVVDGVKVLKVHYSHGNGEMPPTVVHLFRKSLKLDVDEFRRLMGCTLSRDEYIERLRQLGVIPSAAARR